MRLFQMYIHLCPADAPPESFYLQLLKSPISSSWYSEQSLGHSNLCTTVVRLCNSVDEQPVMERTGQKGCDHTDELWMISSVLYEFF